MRNCYSRIFHFAVCYRRLSIQWDLMHAGQRGARCGNILLGFIWFPVEHELSMVLSNRSYWSSQKSSSAVQPWIFAVLTLPWHCRGFKLHTISTISRSPMTTAEAVHTKCNKALLWFAFSLRQCCTFSSAHFGFNLSSGCYQITLISFKSIVDLTLLSLVLHWARGHRMSV